MTLDWTMVVLETVVDTRVVVLGETKVVVVVYTNGFRVQKAKPIVEGSESLVRGKLYHRYREFPCNTSEGESTRFEELPAWLVPTEIGTPLVVQLVPSGEVTHTVA